MFRVSFFPAMITQQLCTHKGLLSSEYLLISLSDFTALLHLKACPIALPLTCWIAHGVPAPESVRA
jgi:hypothetical protein